MKSKFIAFGACALALTACDFQKSAVTTTISATSTDDQKFAYMLGTQMGEHSFGILANQMGEYVNLEALIQGSRDMVKSTKDTSFKLQLTQDSIAALNSRYATIARERYESSKPDSATAANLTDRALMNAYMDSIRKSMPMKAADEGVTLPVTIDEKTSSNVKFSYLVGLQLGNNLRNLSAQFETEFDASYFELGIRDAAKASSDTTFKFQLPKDTLDSVSVRYRAKMDSLRDAAIKKQREEEEKLKAEVASLRGDTLANGMPSKMNSAVKVTGVSYDGDTFGTFSNKPVLVLYFSTTCPHCRHAAPEILAIANEFASSGLTTLAIASGGNPKRAIRTFIDDLKWNENVKVGWDEHRQFGELYSDGYVPKVYLVNPDGTYKLYGAFEKEKDQLKEEIKALLGGKNVEWNIEVPATDSARATVPTASAK